MPKISNNEFIINSTDISKRFSVTIMYNQKHKFYVTIPVEFKDIVHHLSDEDHKKLFIEKIFKNKYSHSEEESQIIFADTEADCLNRTKECFRNLIGKIIQKRNVIIIHYKGDDTIHYNSHEYNKEHPQIGIRFGLTYAVESGIGDAKVYSMYYSYEHFDEPRIHRKELHLDSRSSIIIPDTQENRKFLEQLYINLNTLNNKLKEFTSSSENVLQFISSNVKMIGMGNQVNTIRRGK